MQKGWLLMIYMDNAATTKPHPEVVRAMLPYMNNRYANPSGAYTFSSDVKKDIEHARNVIAETLNANPEEIFITSGGTESDNWALKMTASEKKRGHIITTAIEHKAVLKTCKELEKRGFAVTYVGTDEQGIVKMSDIRKSVRNDTILISVMTANNEIGTIQPIREIGEFAHRKGILFHTDAVQAYTNIPLDMKELPIDMLSTSAHKLNGPKGIGFLYIRDGTLKTPFIHGGGQERGMRSGTENTAGIIGFAKAAEIATGNLDKRTSYERRMRDYMIQRVITEIPFSRLNGSETQRLPGNMNFSFQFIDGGTLIVMLDNQGICASAGSACSTGEGSPSHVLKAIGLPDELAFATVRFTINEEITKQQIDYTVNCLKKDVAQLREMSEEYHALFN
jgi:cysteine desulfurase